MSKDYNRDPDKKDERVFLLYKFIFICGLFLVSLFVLYLGVSDDTKSENGQNSRIDSTKEQTVKTEHEIAEQKEKEEKRKQEEMKQLINDEFNSLTWLQRFINEDGELASNVEPKIYEYYMAAEISNRSIKHKLESAYWSSFENKKNELGLIALNNVQNMGEVAHILNLYKNLSNEVQFEMIRRYALTVEYDAETLNSVFKEFHNAISTDAYTYAKKEELLVLAGAAYALMGNVDKKEFEPLLQAAQDASYYYEFIAANGLKKDEEFIKRYEDMMESFNQAMQKLVALENNKN